MATANSLPADVSPLPTPARAPLIPRTNSPPQQSTVKVIRRKTSFVRDSSEEPPSSHGSIYEAMYLSDRNSDENNRPDSWPLDTLRDPDVSPVQGDENCRLQPSSLNGYRIDDVEFIYGRGTVLNTISEKPSAATIRTLSRPRSMDDIHNSIFVTHDDKLATPKSPRRKLSFSVDDLAEISGSYHEAIALIELKACRLPEVHEIYAEPKSPVHEPLKRPPTPPGMPSWTEHQNVTTRRNNRPANTPGIQNRLQRFLGLPAFSSRTTAPLGTRSSSAPAGFAAPRYRAPRSGYGNLDHHPFNRVPAAKPSVRSASENVPRLPIPAPSPSQHDLFLFSRSTGKRRLLGKKVRFTPSTAAAIDAGLLSNSPTTPIRSSGHSVISDSPSNGQCHHHSISRKLQKPLKYPNTLPSNRTSILPTLAEPSPSINPWRSRSPSRDIPTSTRNLDTDSVRSAASTPTIFMRGAISGSPTSSATQLISASPISPSPMSISMNNSHAEHSLSLASPTTTPNQIPTTDCWKCKLASFTTGIKQTANHWLKESTTCFFFVCCGYDCESERCGSAIGNGRFVNVDIDPGVGIGDERARARGYGNVNGMSVGYWNQVGERRDLLGGNAVVF